MSETDAGRTTVLAELDLLRGGRQPILVGRFVLAESVMHGWSGVVRLTNGETDGVDGAYRSVLHARLAPGAAVALGLWCLAPGSSGPAALELRTWPSVVTKVGTTIGADGRPVTHVHFTDAVTFLAGRRIWGVFDDCELAEAIGGAMSLALGGDGRPSARVTGDDVPTLEIRQMLRESAIRLPYAVATGESLGAWLGQLLGRLGVRMEMLGAGDGTVVAVLKDGAPGGEPLEMLLGAGSASAINAVVDGTAASPPGVARDTVLDNPSTGPSLRVLEEGPVSNLVTAAATTLEEAAVRARFAEEADNAGMMLTTVVTGQPGITPGRRVGFSRPISGARLWQAGAILHAYEYGDYFNTVLLAKDGSAWRRKPPRNVSGARMVSGQVDDGASERGAVVARDRLGRIPVSMVSETPGEEATAADTGEAGVRPSILALPVVDPIAGGMHGFVPQHRQGDRCRMLVNNPLDVEVVGFQYDDQRSIRRSVGDGSMGIIVDHEADAWAGVLFRPSEDTGDNGTDE